MKQKAQPTQVEVQKLFEQWRLTKKGREQIPAALWEAAVSLSGHLSADRIAKLLHLNHTAIRDRIRAHTQGAGAQGQAFIELALPGIIAEADRNPPGIAADCLIEIEKADGTKMKISCKGSCPDVIGLSKAFVSGT
jgi:hypothetical protein